MSRPLDHIETPEQVGGQAEQPKLSTKGWLRWAWRQLTSMRTALLLLLALAIAAVPGSLVPQRSADPNGVTQYFDTNPQLAPVLDQLQFFDVYTSVWFSAIYLLLFVSLVGCIVPRSLHHARALRAAPPKTPTNLRRMPAYSENTVSAGSDSEEVIAEAKRLLRRSRYRVATFTQRDRSGQEAISVSAERGYLRETGNLVFHISLVGILIAVGIGGGFGFSGQRVIVEGQSFVNSLASYDSFSPGRFFDINNLEPYSLSLDEFSVSYEEQNLDAFGQPVDYTADVTITAANGADTNPGQIKVNEPLRIAGTDVFLLGNGYAPQLTVRNPDGDIVFSDDIPFLPQDANLTSLGVVKVPDGLDEQVGMVGFFYPTQSQLTNGAYVSVYPDLTYPVVTLNVYTGDLGINDGIPRSVYALNTDDLTQLTGGETGIDSIELRPGETQELPNGLGSITLESVKRFASFEVHSDPSQGWVLLFSMLVLAGLMLSLLVPRRRIWVKLIPVDDAVVRVEYAGLARGDDAKLQSAVAALQRAHNASIIVHRSNKDKK
ncbi:cytochrome c biogenesis protein ResB [Paramicrobacterium agarici]|uniref:cytochrome c biogenesis protein ResB n=1 Tax=Paramicrobacterium agarici TaxID=630514 RepID=UPI0011514209|nr:cytochrome c biogenesis protein ResB [Microbacterium agarici]TQO22268.1 cytochrome c biogenesis protein [Microbacterium agarici]